nr:MAG TPA: hypothetical protein [Caudoviricetes sp.]
MKLTATDFIASVQTAEAVDSLGVCLQSVENRQFHACKFLLFVILRLIFRFRSFRQNDVRIRRITERMRRGVRKSEIFVNSLFVHVSAVIIACKAVVYALKHGRRVVVSAYFTEAVSYAGFKQIYVYVVVWGRNEKLRIVRRFGIVAGKRSCRSVFVGI